jgi:hypothetical protein
MSSSACDALEVIWPLHRWHYLSLLDPWTLDAVDDSLSVPLVGTTGRELAARALLAGPDGSPQRVSDLLDVSAPMIRRMADADCTPALRDPQILEGARTCLAETADRGSSVEEREAAVVWLQEAARDERQQAAAARRKIAAVSLHKVGMRRDAVGTQKSRSATGFRPRRSLEQVSRCSADGSRAILARPRQPQ